MEFLEKWNWKEQSSEVKSSEYHVGSIIWLRLVANIIGNCLMILKVVHFSIIFFPNILAAMCQLVIGEGDKWRHSLPSLRIWRWQDAPSSSPCPCWPPGSWACSTWTTSTQGWRKPTSTHPHALQKTAMRVSATGDSPGLLLLWRECRMRTR